MEFTENTTKESEGIYLAEEQYKETEKPFNPYKDER